MSEDGLKLENDLCRCCQAEGRFKSLLDSPRGEESFSEMLKIVLDIELKPVSDRKMYTICDTCIRRLEEADNFKQQVLGCERVFQQLYMGDLIKVVEKEPPVKKIETIKDESDSEEDFSLRDLMDASETGNDNDQANTDQTLVIEIPAKPDHEVSEIRQSKSILQSILLEPIRRTDRKRPVAPKQAPPAGKKRKPLKSKPKKKPTLDEKIKMVMDKQEKQKEKKKRQTKKTGGDGDGETSQGDNGDVYAIVENERYKCGRCKKHYKEWQPFRSHIQTKHFSKALLRCPLCLESFKSPVRLMYHNMEKHNIDDRLRCNACDAAFTSKQLLTYHLNVYHKLGQLRKCQFCDFESYSVKPMRRHMSKHKTVKEFQCKYCTKSFLRRNTLNFHERIHTGDRRKVCKECGQAFVQKASLNYHMAKHHPTVLF